MYILSSFHEIVSAAAPPLPPEVLVPFERRRRDTLDDRLGEMTCLIVVEAGDSADDLAAEMGGHVTEAGVDGARALPGGWCELVVCVGDTGFAYVVFVGPRGDDLGDLCRGLTA